MIGLNKGDTRSLDHGSCSPAAQWVYYGAITPRVRRYSVMQILVRPLGNSSKVPNLNRSEERSLDVVLFLFFSLQLIAAVRG